MYIYIYIYIHLYFYTRIYSLFTHESMYTCLLYTQCSFRLQAVFYDACFGKVAFRAYWASLMYTALRRSRPCASNAGRPPAQPCGQHPMTPPEGSPFPHRLMISMGHSIYKHVYIYIYIYIYGFLSHRFIIGTGPGSFLEIFRKALRIHQKNK